jgi:hypothetical protein
MYLNNYQIESLLSFVGYGNFPKADIVFLANEGGLGNRSVEENIVDITERYKANTEHWAKGDWKKGYWKLAEWVPGRIEKVPSSPLLRMTSRMVLALENQDQPCDLWFTPADKDIREQTKRFLMEGGLFSNRPGIQTAILDWRPLPRTNQREPLPYENVEQTEFLNAFSFIQNSNNPYESWKKHRIELIHHLFEIYPIPVLLCVGDIAIKKKVVEHTLGIHDYNEIKLFPSGKKIFVSKGTAGTRTKVILSPFFDYRIMGYSGARDLTQYIRDHILQ